MNPANLLTGIRLAFTPLVVAAIWRYHLAGGEGWRLAAFWLFTVAIVTDIADGYVARRFGCVTKAGSVLDAAADKLLNVLAILVIVACRGSFKTVMWWYPSLVVAKEILTAAGSITLWKKIPLSGFKPLAVGKFSNVLQSATVMWLLLKWSGHQAVYTVSGFVAVLAGVAYVYLWISYSLRGKANWEALVETKD